MNVYGPMKALGFHFNLNWYWANKHFERPGLYYWSLMRQEHVRVIPWVKL